MRTTLNLDRDLIVKVAEMTGETNKSRAVTKALEEFLRRGRLELLLSLKGKVDLVENWRELRQMELGEAKW